MLTRCPSRAASLPLSAPRARSLRPQRRSLPRPAAASAGAPREVLTRQQRTKLDSSSDRDFYAFPRFVKHVDDGFLAQLTQLYRLRLPPGGQVLELGASHVSHLPDDVPLVRRCAAARRHAQALTLRAQTVVGTGLNAEELARNPRLSRFFVRDLNAQPDGWALADASFDAVICCVSVQYYQEPERVFAEVARVLRPGGVAIFSFSTRMFATKAIQAWRDGTPYSRVQLVRSYFAAVPRAFAAPETVTQVPLPGADTPLGQLGAAFSRFMGLSGDPFYAVIARREAEQS